MADKELVTKIAVSSVDGSKKIREIGVSSENIVNINSPNAVVPPKQHTSINGNEYGTATNNMFGHIKLGDGLEIDQINGATNVKFGENGAVRDSDPRLNRYREHSTQDGQEIGIADVERYGHVKLLSTAVPSEIGKVIIEAPSGIAADHPSTQRSIEELYDYILNVRNNIQILPIGSFYEAKNGIDPNNFLVGTWTKVSKKLKETLINENSTDKIITRYSSLIANQGSINVIVLSNMLIVTLNQVRLTKNYDDLFLPIINLNLDKLGIASGYPQTYFTLTSDGGNAFLMGSFWGGTFKSNQNDITMKGGDITINDSIVKGSSSQIQADRDIDGTIYLPLKEDNIIDSKAYSIVWERIS